MQNYFINNKRCIYDDLKQNNLIKSVPTEVSLHIVKLIAVV